MTQLEPEGPHRPHVLRVDLARLAREGARGGTSFERFRDPDPRLERIGCASGSALAHVMLHRYVERDPEADCPLILSVGEAVRAALPTAARTSVLSRSPLTGFLSEGQVGGGFGRALASVTDALVLCGTSGARGAVLVVDAGPRVELRVVDALVGATPRAAARHIERTFGPCAALAIGPAGEAGIPFASLAALEDPPSFVGRGGLGAVMGRLGLKAIVVLAAPVEPDPARAPRDRELQRTLLASPRLRARGAGGTLERAASFRARGTVAGPGGACGEVVASLETIQSQSVGKKGCEGCPTPCGLVFEHVHPAGSTRHVGRYSALFALGASAGSEPASLQALLERCDDLGLDAKEAGALLEIAARAADGGARARWDVDRSLACLDDIVARRGIGAVLARGARAAASALGQTRESCTARGEAACPDTNLALRLGSAVGVRGADPMRAFPFLALDAASRERLIAALSPVVLPPGAEDPGDPAGKGRIVWWHENLSCALDATGFCAFSAAGLISDGVCTLDELARRIAPERIADAPSPGRALLALGASIATLQRATTALLRVDAAIDVEDPLLVHPSMVPEYARWRGLGADLAPAASTLALLGDEALLDLGREHADPARVAPIEQRIEPVAAGTISFVASGPLKAALAGRATHEFTLPARLDACIEQLAHEVPRAAPWLVIRGQTVPQAWRAGRRLAPGDAVFAGDRIELVIAIGGG